MFSNPEYCQQQRQHLALLFKSLPKLFYLLKQRLGFILLL